jgi:hypothetical protein
MDPEALDGLRGPDGALEITVPGAWLDEGARICLRVPRLVTCAACEGGGCEHCGLSGALTTRERGEAEKRAELTLPKKTPPPGARLRLPRLGGEAEEELVPRGHLLVHVKPGAAADPIVARLQCEVLVPTLRVRSHPADLSPWVMRTAVFVGTAGAVLVLWALLH